MEPIKLTNRRKEIKDISVTCMTGSYVIDIINFYKDRRDELLKQLSEI